MSTLDQNDIIFVTDKFPDNDTLHGRAAQNLVSYYLSQNLKVTVIAEGPDRKDVWYKGQYRYISLGLTNREYTTKTSLKAKLRATLALKSMPAHKMVIIDANAYLVTSTVDQWSKKFGIPQVYWAHKVYPESFSALGLPVRKSNGLKLKKTLRQVMKRSQSVIVESLSVYKYLSHTGTDTRRIKIIDSWGFIPLKSKTPKKLSGSANDNNGLGKSFAPSASNLKRDPVSQKFRVLYSGEVLKGKGLQSVLITAQKMLKDYPEIEFVFSGYGEGMSYLYEERMKRQLDNIRLMPLQPKTEYMKFLQTGDVHLVLEEGRNGRVMSSSNVTQAVAAQRPFVLLGERAEAKESLAPIGEAVPGQIVEEDDAYSLYKAILTYRESADAWFRDHNLASNIATQNKPQSLMRWAQLTKKNFNY